MQPKTTLTALVHAVACLAAAACGGGGGSVSRADYARGCAAIEACEAPVGANFCLNYFEDWPPEQIRCAIDAQGDCNAILACVGLRRDDDPTCQPHCEGNVRVSCDGGSAWRMDCGVFPFAPGPVCVEDAEFGVACVSGTGCTTAGLSCDGNKQRYCSTSGAYYEGTCGSASCYDGRCSEVPLTPCTVPPGGNDVVCDGDVVIMCADGLESRFDCSGFDPDLTCLTWTDGAGGTYTGCDFPGTCSGLDEPTCDGTSVVVCDHGSPATADCASIGFTSCGTAAGTGQCY